RPRRPGDPHRRQPHAGVLPRAAAAGRHLELVPLQLPHLDRHRGADPAVRVDGGLRPLAPGVPGEAAIYLMIVIGLMIPTQVLIVPLFQELRVLQLLNTYWAVILPQIPSVIAVFIFKQFFDGIPKELEEAARVDGAGLWRIYWGVIMPLSRPVTAAVAILTFVWTWNNLLLPLFVLSNPDLMTIPVGLATVQGSFGLRYADIQAGALLAALPLVVLYMFFQRQIVEGVTGSGLKG